MLTKAISETPGGLNEHRWQKLVKVATRDAVVHVTDGGPLVRIGQSRSFVTALAACTTSVVAPAGSDWAQAIAKREEQQTRTQIEAMGLPPHEVNEFMQQWRTRRKT
jgi:hypothetical protein